MAEPVPATPEPEQEEVYDAIERDLNLAEIQAVIDALESCLLVFDEEQQKQTLKVIDALESIKLIAV